MSAARAVLRAATRRMAALASSSSRPPTAATAAAPRRGLATLVARPQKAAALSSSHTAAAWPHAPQHRRATAAFATGSGSSSNVNAGLAEALEDEIKYEAENYEAPEGISSPPAGWGLDESPGDVLVSLTRQGILPGEIVTVELLADEQDDDDDEAALFEGADDDDDDGEEGGKGKAADDEDGDDLEFDDAVVFTAAVARGESALVFECRSDGSYLQVLSVALTPNPDAVGAGDDDDEDALLDDDETAYVGPLYEELDERLQAEFESYLSARGVDAELGGFLAEYAADKEQREYVAWLERVKAFVSQK